MTMQTVLEDDKERLLSRISDTDRNGVIRELQSELDRVLMTFNEEESSEIIRETVNAMMQTARSAVNLIDIEGTARIFGQTQYRTGEKESTFTTVSKKKNHTRGHPAGKPSLRFWILLIMSILCMIWTVYSAAPILGTTDGKSFLHILAGAILTAGTAFAAGESIKSPGVFSAEKLFAEASVDPEKAYRALLSVILTMDQVVDSIRASEELKKRSALTGDQEHGVPADPAELELMAQLLEDAYSRKQEEEQAEELCMHLKYYLHQKEIDVVDYEKLQANPGTSKDRETLLHEAWFDLIPAYAPGTIRPALVRNGILLKKGLASNG